jgi:hypothetical protein
MKALTQCYKMHIHITVFKYLIVDEYLFAGPSMQQQRGVDRTKMRHLARHPELNLSQLILVDSVSECPNQVLQYSYRHSIPFFEHNVEKEGQKAQIVVKMCTSLNHP